MQGPRPSRPSWENMVSDPKDKKIAEDVRSFLILHNKSLNELRDK